MRPDNTITEWYFIHCFWLLTASPGHRQPGLCVLGSRAQDGVGDTEVSARRSCSAEGGVGTPTSTPQPVPPAPPHLSSCPPTGDKRSGRPLHSEPAWAVRLRHRLFPRWGALSSTPGRALVFFDSYESWTPALSRGSEIPRSPDLISDVW